MRTRFYLVFLALGSMLALRAFADWGSPTKWSQMDAADTYAGASWIDYDTPSDAMSADDFMCTQTGWLNEIRFVGFSYYGEAYIQNFRVGIWSDVPGTPNDASHPGSLLYQYEVGPADPNDPLKVGWYSPGYWDGSYSYEYRVDLPRDHWFWQEGTTSNPIVYWLSIQGVMVTDGYFDAWYWNFRDRNLPTHLDDAAFQSNYFGYAPWSNWGVDPTDAVNLYDGPLPSGWKSLDLMFEVHGTPEPSALAVVGLGLLALVRRRRK